MEENFEMVAKTMKGLEEVLAEELRGMGAKNVEPGRRMVSFYGDLEMLYKANLCCRTALRILKPFYKFNASTPDELYERVKEFDWGSVLSLDKTFCIDTVAFSEDFTHSHFVTYRVKDAIVDWFQDRFGPNKRPGVRLTDADVMINVHISHDNVTLSLDSSGESLHKRGYRVAQTEAPINEVLAAGIILRSGWRGDCPLVDPMCGSGTFLIEAALIAANINPGIYRKSFAFENWKDFDAELFDRLYNDDSGERQVEFKIYGSDISPAAIQVAQKNIKSAGVGKYIDLQVKPLSAWDEAPKPAGVLITNPPYGERISAPDMEALYQLIGSKLKNVFQGYHAWIIGYREDYFMKIGLAPSEKLAVLNGSLECELREYIIFEGDKRSFLASGGTIRRRRDEGGERADDTPPRRERSVDRFSDRRDGTERRERRERQGDRRDASGDRRERRSDRFGDRPDRRDRNDRFDRNDRRDRADRRDRFDRHDRGDRFDRSNRAEAPKAPVSENPLAVRRNPNALKMIQGKKPSLPPAEGPTMRSRGWKKRGFNPGEGSDNTPNE